MVQDDSSQDIAFLLFRDCTNFLFLIPVHPFHATHTLLRGILWDPNPI